jgi:hypothetical protein
MYMQRIGDCQGRRERQGALSMTEHQIRKVQNVCAVGVTMILSTSTDEG